MLYNVGLEFVPDDITTTITVPVPKASYPPIHKPPKLLPDACYTPLPLRITSPPDIYLHAAAARTTTRNLPSEMALNEPHPTGHISLDHEMMTKNDITRKDMMMIYMPPHPFRNSFEEEFCLRLYNHLKHALSRCTQSISRVCGL